MGELKYRQRIGISVDKLTVERLNELSEQTGVAKSKLVDFAVFLLNEKFKDGGSVKPDNYTDSAERDDR